LNIDILHSEHVSVYHSSFGGNPAYIAYISKSIDTIHLLLFDEVVTGTKLNNNNCVTHLYYGNIYVWGNDISWIPK